MSESSPSLGGKAPRWSQDRRLRFIDFRLQWQGRLNRSDLMEFFGISVPQASADIAVYMDRAPGNIEYDRSSRTYLASSSFKAIFQSSGPDQYLAQLLAIDRGILDPAQAQIGYLLPTESVHVPSRTIDRTILASLIRAIDGSQTVRVRYQSIARDEPQWRDISPHAMCTDGLRWHARAYCHLRAGYRDFVLGRILELEGTRQPKVSAEEDYEWHNFIEIVLAPNPELNAQQRTGVEIDYGMTAGRVSFKCRQAMLFYTLRTLNFDNEGIPQKGERQLVILNLHEVQPNLPKLGQF